MPWPSSTFMRARVHSSNVESGSSLADLVFGSLTDRQMRVRPGGRGPVAQVEDVAVNLILTAGEAGARRRMVVSPRRSSHGRGEGMTDSGPRRLPLASERCARILGSLVAVSLSVFFALTAGPSVGQERIVSKHDEDRILCLNRSRWEAEARRMVDSQTWKRLPGPGDEGTGVMATDPRTGVGLAVRPSFRDGQSRPD